MSISCNAILGVIQHCNKYNLYFRLMSICRKNRSIDYFKLFKFNFSDAVKKTNKYTISSSDDHVRAKKSKATRLTSFQGPASASRTISSSDDHVRAKKAKAPRLSSFHGPANAARTIITRRGVKLSDMGLMVFYYILMQIKIIK
jgi:hypothetical protein